MSLEISDVSIRCMGCTQLQTLDQAVRGSWKMCDHCNFSICAGCYGHLDEKKLCLSYVCSPKKRSLDPVPIPVEKILVFAKEHQHGEGKKGLLYKLFFEEGENIHSLPFFVSREQEIKNTADTLDKPTQVQEEIWKSFELVITKRRGGKFISWEKVY